MTPRIRSFVSLYAGKKQAGKKELKAYKDVIKYLEYIPKDAAAPPR